MTVPAIVRRKDYTCDGSNVTFPYTWKVAAASELKVKIRDLSNNEVTLVYPTDFSITGLNVTDGGNIVTTAAYAAGYHLTILPSLEIKQTASFRNQNSFYPWKHEDALDYLTMLLQQQDEELGRCMKLSDTNTDVVYDMPVAVSGNCWGWDASGNSIAQMGAPTLASNLLASGGAGMVGYSSGASYALGTIGAALQAAQPGGALRPADLAAVAGAGMVGYSASYAYGAGTLGYVVKNLPVIDLTAPGPIGGTTAGAGYFTTLSSSGLATLNSLSVTTLTVTSTATFNGIANAMAGFREKYNAVAASAIDCALGNAFSKTISANTTLTVANVPASGSCYRMILELTNGGAYAVTWWSGVKWANGTAPTLTTSGRDMLAFFTRDGGATWSGSVIGKAFA